MEHYKPRIALAAVRRTIPLVSKLWWLNQGIRGLALCTHQLQFVAEWGAYNPERLDYFID